MALAALIGGCLVLARPSPEGKPTTQASTGHWAPVEPPGWVDSPEAKAGNDKLTGPDGFEFADTKRVKTLRVTPGGVVEKADGR